MTDKELLELSAKAAGIQLWSHPSDDKPYADSPMRVWNPLTDDGDALRLAVKLRLKISERVAEVWKDGKETVYIFEDDGDSYAATRRAIVRAAAEIGKTL